MRPSIRNEVTATLGGQGVTLSGAVASSYDSAGGVENISPDERINETAVYVHYAKNREAMGVQRKNLGGGGASLWNEGDVQKALNLNHEYVISAELHSNKDRNVGWRIGLAGPGSLDDFERTQLVEHPRLIRDMESPGHFDGTFQTGVNISVCGFHDPLFQTRNGIPVFTVSHVFLTGEVVNELLMSQM